MNSRLIVFGCALVVGLGGCVKTRTQLREDAGEGPVQRQTVAQQRAEAASPPAVAKPMPVPARLDEFDDQMRQLNGRVDNAENLANQVAARQQGEKESVTKMAQAIDAKFMAYEEEIKKLEARVAELDGEVSRLKSTPGTAAPVKGRTAYDEGEELFGAKKWKEAIVAYQKYRDANPKGKSYGDATYKIGVCFQELKMKDEAKAFFEEVIAKYPGSKDAKKASLRMKSIK
ncbi:MAG TPA: tetratricopeptide repeat protein [Bdellovibrionales bacterium]|nr:tetratricopeptide repeat protein [Bdellovibrionales bacterium]